jgi:hypothetical protein
MELGQIVTVEVKNPLTRKVLIDETGSAEITGKLDHEDEMAVILDYWLPGMARIGGALVVSRAFDLSIRDATPEEVATYDARKGFPTEVNYILTYTNPSLVRGEALVQWLDECEMQADAEEE